MENLTSELKEELRHCGADLIGIGDITMLPEKDRKNMKYGIAVGIAIDASVIAGIENGPTMDYYNAYHSLNETLDRIVTSGAAYIRCKGYEAIAQTRKEVSMDSTEYHTVLPHKTIATRAGVGWIGKNAMLITKDYGSAVRISAILTNAPLQPAKAINKSRCGSCTACKEACPGEAISGRLWNMNTQREEIFDPVRCRGTARRLSMELLDKEITLCGKCIFVCPFTKKYLGLIKSQ